MCELDPVNGQVISIGQALRSPKTTSAACAVAATGSLGGGAIIPNPSKRCVVAPLPGEPLAKIQKLSASEEFLYNLQVQLQERADMQKEEEHKLKMKILWKQLEGEEDERERKKRIDEMKIKILERDLAKYQN